MRYSMSMRYRITSVYYSIHGEGHYVGTPMVFVRFAECNCACTYCNTDYRIRRLMTTMELMDEIEKYPDAAVCLTGGEPMLQVDEELLIALSDLRRRVHLETNGTIAMSMRIATMIDWITCSPKHNAPLHLNPAWVNEYRLSYPFEVDYERIALLNPSAEWFIQPIILEPKTAKHTRDAIIFCKRNPAWRLSIQLCNRLLIP